MKEGKGSGSWFFLNSEWVTVELTRCHCAQILGGKAAKSKSISLLVMVPDSHSLIGL